MNEEEKQKMLDQFREKEQKQDGQEVTEDPWTEEDIRAAANRIAERIGLNVRW